MSCPSGPQSAQFGYQSAKTRYQSEYLPSVQQPGQANYQTVPQPSGLQSAQGSYQSVHSRFQAPIYKPTSQLAHTGFQPSMQEESSFQYLSSLGSQALEQPSNVFIACGFESLLQSLQPFRIQHHFIPNLLKASVCLQVWGVCNKQIHRCITDVFHGLMFVFCNKINNSKCACGFGVHWLYQFKCAEDSNVVYKLYSDNFFIIYNIKYMTIYIYYLH